MTKLALAAVAAVIASGYAFAEREQVQMSVHVSDIQSASDAKTVLGELDVAAKRICIEADTWTRRLNFSDNKRCISEAVESGVKAISNPLLTDAWKARKNG